MNNEIKISETEDLKYKVTEAEEPDEDDLDPAPLPLPKRMRLVGIAAAVICTAGLIFSGERLFGTLSAFFNRYFSTTFSFITVNGNAWSTRHYLFTNCCSFLADIVPDITFLVLLFITLIISIRIIRHCTPFLIKNVRTLNAVKYCLLFLLIAPPVCRIISSIGSFSIGSFLLYVLTQIIGTFRIYTIAAILLVLFCRECVYYGTMLQTESDETL